MNVVLSFTGCYDDKGNYDYATLDSLAISLPSNNVQASLGDTLKITPTITTTIPESDLTYYWEVEYKPTNSYIKYVPIATGKNLSYIVALNDTMPSLTNYTMRLHAVQKSTNRDFYSDSFTMTITGQVNGLVVLHGNDVQSDVGLVRASEFMATSGTSIVTEVKPYFWSSVNGSKIKGKGKQIIQTISSYLNWASSGYNGVTGVDCADVWVITDKGGSFASYASFKKEGNWSDGFYGKLNQDTPQSIYINGQYVEAIDGGELFMKQYSLYTFVTPLITKSSGYYLKTSVYIPSYKKLAQGFFFDSKTRAFIGIPYFNGVNDITYYTMTTSSDVCNLGDIQADLIYMDQGGTSGHYLAVMEDDSSNKFLLEIDLAGGDEHEQENMAYAKYDMTTLTDIDNAKYYAFGDDEPNMCYYGTSDAVYHFSAIKGNALSATKLQYSDGSYVDFGGQTITMLKVLKPAVTTSPTFNYFNRNKILLVGTYEGGAGTGKLYSLTIDELTGLVISKNIYSGFDEISDANIKGF